MFASLLPLPPSPPPKKKKIKKSVKDASVLDIFRKHSRCSLLSSLCLPRPAPYPSACHFSTLTQEILQDYLKQGRRKRGPVRACIAYDPPKKDGQGFKRTGHPTTAESWIALPATLPRKDKVSRGQGNILLLPRVGLHCLRPSQERDRVSRGPGHPTTAESWIALPATLPRKDRVSRGWGHPTTQRVGLHCL